jgi:hypothetical protein
MFEQLLTERCPIAGSTQKSATIGEIGNEALHRHRASGFRMAS